VGCCCLRGCLQCSELLVQEPQESVCLHPVVERLLVQNCLRSEEHLRRAIWKSWTASWGISCRTGLLSKTGAGPLLVTLRRPACSFAGLLQCFSQCNAHDAASAYVHVCLQGQKNAHSGHLARSQEGRAGCAAP